MISEGNFQIYSFLSTSLDNKKLSKFCFNVLTLNDVNFCLFLNRVMNIHSKNWKSIDDFKIIVNACDCNIEYACCNSDSIFNEFLKDHSITSTSFSYSNDLFQIFLGCYIFLKELLSWFNLHIFINFFNLSKFLNIIQPKHFLFKTTSLNSMKETLQILLSTFSKFLEKTIVQQFSIIAPLFVQLVFNLFSTIVA
jgi:hypothetical protein